jgi:hypothetical protein
MSEHSASNPQPADWKQYPYRPDWGNPRWFQFPRIDGYDPQLGMVTYYLDGFVRGKDSGRLYAVMTIFTAMKIVRGKLHLAFNTFALYDCETGHYGTCTDTDHPLRLWRKRKFFSAPGHLEIRYQSAYGENSWLSQSDGRGGIRPFAWDLELHGQDHHGEAMELTLSVEADRPPAPLGGRELEGEMMFLGGEETYSYFQSGLTMKGRVRWGDREEEVEGTVGWIDRQWAVEDFTVYQDRTNSRYRNEWRVMQFDNGWDMSCFFQYHRHQQNRKVPWSGLSAQGPGPDFEIKSTTEVLLDPLDFIRSPGVVRPFFIITKGPRWFPHGYRMRVPEWDMDITATPLVDAPAHQLLIEYWTGPVRLEGTVFGEKVKGYGFDERSRPHVRNFELTEILRILISNREDGTPEERRALRYRLSEVEALCLRDDPRAALAYLERRVAPLLSNQPEEMQAALAPVLEDLRHLLRTRGRPR